MQFSFFALLAALYLEVISNRWGAGRVLASHHCGPDSIPRPGVTCSLSLLLILVLALRFFFSCFSPSAKTNVLNRIIQHHWKKFTWNFLLLIMNFPRILPRFDFFYEQNSPLATLKLTQSHVNSLLTTCIVPRISQTKGKVQTENNQSGSPLWNIIDFSSTMYLPSYEVAIYLWQRPIGYTTVSVCFSQ